MFESSPRRGSRDLGIMAWETAFSKSMWSARPPLESSCSKLPNSRGCRPQAPAARAAVSSEVAQVIVGLEDSACRLPTGASRVESRPRCLTPSPPTNTLLKKWNSRRADQLLRNYVFLQSVSESTSRFISQHPEVSGESPGVPGAPPPAVFE